MGSPVALSVTVCGLPLVTVLLIVLVPFCPAVTVTALGLAAREKSSGGGAAVMVRVRLMPWVAAVPLR